MDNDPAGEARPPGGARLRLFVYGSLRVGQDNPMAIRLHRQARYAGTGTVRGCLYEVDWYPGLVLDAASDERVVGDVVELAPAGAGRLLAQLDEYEGKAFRRQAVEVTLADETRVSAFAYTYAASVAGLPRVARGDWLWRG